MAVLDPSQIGNFLDFIDLVDIIEDNIKDELERLFTEQEAAYLLMFAKPIDALFIELDKLEGSNLSLNDKILIGLSNAELERERLLAGIVEDFQTRLDAQVGDLATVTARLESKVVDGIAQGVSELLSFSTTVVQNIEGRLSNQVEDVLERTNRVINAAQARMQALAQAAIDTAQEIIERTTGTLSALGETLGATIGGLPGLIIEGASVLLSPILTPISTFLGFFGRDKINEALTELDPLITPLEDDPDTGEDFKRFTKGGVPALVIGAIGAIIGLLVTLPIQWVMSGFKGKLVKVEQGSMSRDRPTLLNPPDMLELLRRKNIDIPGMEDTFNKLGYPDLTRAQILELRFQLTGLNELISLWRRNLITEEVFDFRIAKLGWIDEQIKEFKLLAFQIPPLQDLITFAVREAFELEVADRFGQLEGLPDDIRQAFEDNLAQFGSGVSGSVGAFAEFAKQSGISKEWIATYWASHWREPGLNQIYAMAHRLAPDIVERRREAFTESGFDADNLAFTIDDIDTALRKQDITPFWRDKLRAIAFRPITRVDIRRFHKLGIINEEELTIRYRELGFSVGDAQLMTEFTVAFNKAVPEDEDIETKNLTKNQILDFFEQGVLSENEAEGFLTEIGYSPEASATFVSLKASDLLRNQRDLAIKTVRIKFDNELIDFNEAVTSLDALNIPPVQRALILAQLEAEILSRVRLPSRAELDKFVAEEVIDGELYERELLRLGYPQEWVARFRKLNLPEE